MELTSKKALITGGASGIGRAIAVELAHAGASIGIVDLKVDEQAESLLEEIESAGAKGVAFEADVSAFNTADDCVQGIVDKFGGLDILVCNAGTNRDGVIWKMSESNWDTVIDVNLKGCFNFIRAAAPHLRAQKSGKIVAICSINGLRGKFGQANYAASKSGIIGMIKTVARELGPSGVNVNAVAPGLIETGMTRGLPKTVKDKALEETALGRLGTPEDVARAVSFLCSDAARHITGEVIKVDGGQYI